MSFNIYCPNIFLSLSLCSLFISRLCECAGRELSDKSREEKIIYTGKTHYPINSDDKS